MELRDYVGVFAYKKEHSLNKEPLRIDVVVRQQEAAAVVLPMKNSAPIFRTHNIIEDKSPRDYISVCRWIFDAYYLVADAIFTIYGADTFGGSECYEVTAEFPGFTFISQTHGAPW